LNVDGNMISKHPQMTLTLEHLGSYPVRAADWVCPFQIGYHRNLRRALSALLVLLICLGMMSPLLAAPAEVKLPACCRRDGKHRCGMMAAQQGKSVQTTSGSKLQAAKCAEFPQSVVVAGPVLNLVPAKLIQHAWLQSERAFLAQSAQAESTPCLSRNLDRGPPTYFS